MPSKFRTYKTDIDIQGVATLVGTNASQGKAGLDAISAWITAQATSLGQPATNLRLYAVRDETNTLTFELSEVPIV